MDEAPTLILAGAAGVGLGALFFGGLWWTLQRGLASRWPALWFLGSLLIRMGVTLSGFYFVSGGRWQRLLCCLLGFVVSRVAVTRLTRPPAGTRGRAAIEVSHAP